MRAMTTTRITPLIATLAAAAGLAGCASSGPTGSEILTGSIKPDAARLVIYRTSPLGFAIQPDYIVNGQKIGISTPNGFVVCDMAPGKADVAVANATFNVNLFGGTDKAAPLLTPGKTTYLSATPQMGLTIGIITLTEVTEAQGRADTASLHKIESTCGKV